MIKKTKDYDIFKLHESNRDLDKLTIKKLVSSIQSRNLLEFRPILVDKKMQIIDGQHRLAAARFLEIEIYYQVDESAQKDDIVRLNLNQKGWVLLDYLKYYSSSGIEDYEKLESFLKEHNLDIRQALGLLLNGGAYATRIFKSGNFKFPVDEKLQHHLDILDKFKKVLDFIKKTRSDGVLLCNSQRIRRAVIDILKNRSVVFEIFMGKLEFNVTRLHKCAGTVDAYSMFKDVYNWKNHSPVE